MALQNRFTPILLEWNTEQNNRSMPWKGEKDPYKIWLSEIILQQTRVEQGLAYYERFTETFPTITDLAEAPDDKVFKLWEGLGYYSRCRNLIATARLVATEYKGRFPSTYKEILSLKGVGPYTAAAISSFAYNLPHAVLDGNVYRVLSRFTGSDIPIDSTAGKQFFSELANELLDKKRPAAWNQAIMDFGAVVCKPRQPECLSCPLSKNCVAFQTGRTTELPVKGKQLVKRTRWMYYVVASWKKEVYIRKRAGKDIWKDLYEFIPVESAAALKPEEVPAAASLKALNNLPVLDFSSVIRHELSHQTIFLQLIHVNLKRKPDWGPEWIAVAPEKLSTYAFPVVLKNRL